MTWREFLGLALQRVTNLNEHVNIRIIYRDKNNTAIAEQLVHPTLIGIKNSISVEFREIETKLKRRF